MAVGTEDLFESYLADIDRELDRPAPSTWAEMKTLRKETEEKLKHAANLIPNLPPERQSLAQQSLWFREGKLNFNLAMKGFVDKPGQRAIPPLTKLVAADPTSGSGWYMLANLYAQEGRGPKAREAYERAINGDDRELALEAQKELIALQHDKRITGPKVSLIIAGVLVLASLIFWPCLIFTVPYLAYRGFQYAKKNG